mgnify:CR=1 FL=1
MEAAAPGSGEGLAVELVDLLESLQAVGDEAGTDDVEARAAGAPKLADQTWLYAADDEPAALKTFLEQQILHPRNNVMPAWKDALGDAKIKVVAAYVYSLSHDEDETGAAAAETAQAAEKR